MKTFLIALLVLTTFHSYARTSTANCKVISENGEVLLNTRPIYPIRSSSLFRVHDQYFLEMSYHAIGSFVRVYELKMPHAPWTFGESLIKETDLKLSGENQEGEMAIDGILPGATLTCQVQG